MPPSPTHYDLLELPAGASAEELRGAFRRLSKRYHPDTTSLPAAEAEQAFNRLRAAYAVLSDPQARRAYDQQLVARRPLPAPPPVVVVVERPLPLRRALSGGEWFALLLLGLALTASLVLGVGLAWARGKELVRPPSWMLTDTTTTAITPTPATAMVTALPAAETPLYNHPLPALEEWLRQLGASQERPNASAWDLHRPDWSARVLLDGEELRVTWEQEGRETSRTFPYGLSRSDVEAAILAGP